MTAVAAVTGGTGAIGRAIARGLAAEGYDVLTGSVDAGEKAADGITVRRLDVTDADSVAAFLGPLDRLDVLVNCAGITAREGREFDPEVFARVIDVNLTGAMRMCVAAKALLADSPNASVVNICSMLSYFGSPTVPAYAASKGGLLQLTRSLAAAWASDGIRVNGVAPGYIETNLTEAIHADPGRRRRIEERTPMARWGRPEEVVGAVRYLCSEAAGFVTGTVVTVDGGYAAA